MKKRLLIVVALVAIIVIAALTLTACNKFKWGKIDGGDSSAARMMRSFTRSTSASAPPRMSNAMSIFIAMAQNAAA